MDLRNPIRKKSHIDDKSSNLFISYSSSIFIKPYLLFLSPKRKLFYKYPNTQLFYPIQRLFSLSSHSIISALSILSPHDFLFLPSLVFFLSPESDCPDFSYFRLFLAKTLFLEFVDLEKLLNLGSRITRFRLLFYQLWPLQVSQFCCHISLAISLFHSFSPFFFSSSSRFH